MKFEHTERMNLVTLYEGEELKVGMMIYDNHPFIHFDYSRVTPSIYKEIKFRLAEVKYLLSSIGYPYVFGVHAKEMTGVTKLAERLGFKKIGETAEGGTVVVLETNEDG